MSKPKAACGRPFLTERVVQVLRLTTAGAPHLDFEMWETTKASGVVALASVLPGPKIARVSSSSPKARPNLQNCRAKNPVPPPNVTNPPDNTIRFPRTITRPPIYIKNRPSYITRTAPKFSLRGRPTQCLILNGSIAKQVPSPSR